MQSSSLSVKRSMSVWRSDVEARQGPLIALGVAIRRALCARCLAICLCGLSSLLCDTLLAEQQPPAASPSENRRQVIEGLEDLEVLAINPGFEKLLQRATSVTRGGAESFLDGKKWLAVGAGRVGFTDETGKVRSPSDVTKAARAKALKELATLLHGVRMTAKDTATTTTIEKPRGSELIEVFRSVSKEQIEATLTGAEVVGLWKLDDGDSLVVMVAVGDPTHPLFERREATGNPSNATQHDRRNEMWSNKWKESFSTRPAILSGGASLFRVDPHNVVILCVGKAKLNGDPESNPHKELVASTSAAREALSFLKGVKVSSSNAVNQKTRRITAEEVTLFHEAAESVERITSEKLLEQTRINKPVGTWLSADGKFYYQALALPLTPAEQTRSSHDRVR